jgi:hypothetical protein
LAFSGKLIAFETGIRSLTDYLLGDVYFKIPCEGKNLDRARTQFQLVQQLEHCEPHLQALVERLAKARKVRAVG